MTKINLYKDGNVPAKKEPKIEMAETHELLVQIINYANKHKMTQEHLIQTYQILLNGTFYDLGYTDKQAKNIYGVFLESYKRYKNLKNRSQEERETSMKKLDFLDDSL